MGSCNTGSASAKGSAVGLSGDPVGVPVKVSDSLLTSCRGGGKLLSAGMGATAKASVAYVSVSWPVSWGISKPEGLGSRVS